MNVDDAILANCKPEWLKVSRVIYMAREMTSLADDDEGCGAIAERLAGLANEGILEVVGSLDDWRSSEVRLGV